MAGINWKAALITAAIGATSAGVALYTHKKTKSMPLALAAAGGTSLVLPIAIVFAMDKMGMTGLAGLVMEQVAALPELRSRGAQGDYRGLVMEQVSGCGYGQYAA